MDHSDLDLGIRYTCVLCIPCQAVLSRVDTETMLDFSCCWFAFDRLQDGSASTVANRSFNRIIMVSPTIKRHKSLKPKECKRNMAYLMPIAQELRLLAPPGLIEVGPQCNDGELFVTQRLTQVCTGVKESAADGRYSGKYYMKLSYRSENVSTLWTSLTFAQTNTGKVDIS